MGSGGDIREGSSRLAPDGRCVFDMLAVERGVDLARGEQQKRILAQRPDLLNDLIRQSVELRLVAGHGLRVKCKLNVLF